MSLDIIPDEIQLHILCDAVHTPRHFACITLAWRRWYALGPDLFRARLNRYLHIVLIPTRLLPREVPGVQFLREEPLDRIMVDAQPAPEMIPAMSDDELLRLMHSFHPLDVIHSRNFALRPRRVEIETAICMGRNYILEPCGPVPNPAELRYALLAGRNLSHITRDVAMRHYAGMDELLRLPCVTLDDVHSIIGKAYFRDKAMAPLVQSALTRNDLPKEFFRRFGRYIGNDPVMYSPAGLDWCIKCKLASFKYRGLISVWHLYAVMRLSDKRLSRDVIVHLIEHVPKNSSRLMEIVTHPDMSAECCSQMITMHPHYASALAQRFDLDGMLLAPHLNRMLETHRNMITNRRPNVREFIAIQTLRRNIHRAREMKK